MKLLVKKKNNNNIDNASSELAVRIFSGDSKAENELCVKYKAKVFYIIRRKNISCIDEKDLSQDILHDVLLQCRKKKINNLPAFIRKICHNKCIDLIRKNKNAEFIEINENTTIKDPTSNPLKTILTTEEQQLIIKAFAKLPERERRILDLKFNNEWTSKQIGGHLGLKEENVRKISQRALKKLRKICSKL